MPSTGLDRRCRQEQGTREICVLWQDRRAAAELSALTPACCLQQQFCNTSSAPLHRELAQAVSIAITSRLSNSALSHCVVTLQIRWVTVPTYMWERKMSCWSVLASLDFGGLSCLPMKHMDCVARDIAACLVVNRKFRKHVHTSSTGVLSS